MKVLRWLALAGAVVLLTITAMWAIGSHLPVGHRASVSRSIAADADSVWRRIHHIEAWPSWQDVTVEVLGEDSVRVRQAGETLVYRIDRPRPRVLVTEIVTPGLPFGGRWTWSVTSGERSATVTIVEDGEVYDPFFRFFNRFVFGHDSTIRGTLDALEASLEGP